VPYAKELPMTESPKYFVVRKQKEIEIRRYAGYIQAEVSIDEKDHRSAIEKGFRILAGFIFGNNIPRRTIDVTASVKTPQSQRIAMTTPVTVTGSDRFTVAFIMPSEYKLETLPMPKDDNIHFKTIQPHQMAAIRFSGYFQPDVIRKNQERLGAWLQEQGLETEGDFIIAGYNPPWVPGFMARNEVMIRIKT
jgi:effector-binding domain-containing protein